MEKLTLLATERIEKDSDGFNALILRQVVVNPSNDFV